jgi:type IV pilus assembly protein PilB
MNKSEELLRLLVAKNLLPALKAEEIKAKLGAAFDLKDYLVKNKLIDPEKLAEMEAGLFNLPYKKLVDEDVLDEVLNVIPKEVAKNYGLVCFERVGSSIKIGLTKSDFKAIEAINFFTMEQGLKAEFYFISRHSFEDVFKQYDKMEEEISSALEVKAKNEGEEILQVKQESSETINDEDANSAPVAKIVSVIIRHAVESRASDIHIEPYEKESRVRYRIDGILHTSLALPLNIHNAVVARIKVLAKLKLDETRIPQDGRIRLLINGHEIDFRISTLPLANFEKVVMRILDSSKGTPILEDLGFNNHSLVLIRRGIKKTMGIVLVTGPTGSGKSTTLYAILSILNQEGVNISTLEDPIEYQIKGINQSQVKPKIGYTFATGLRSFLRQDPNIIMVGEIRDDETAELSIHAGLTGHLVLSTLHTNDALGGILRLLDMKIEPFLLASTLKTIIAQRLVRRLCNYCRKEVPLAPDVLADCLADIRSLPAADFKQEFPKLTSPDELATAKTYAPVGCPRCSNTGYMERVCISESIEINEMIKDMIVNRQHELNLGAIMKSQDFVSMKQDGSIKILKGITNIDEVTRVVEN